MGQEDDIHLHYGIDIFWTDGSDPRLKTKVVGDFNVHFPSGFELSVSPGMRAGAKGSPSPSPEELFITSISSCVMLSFIELAKGNDLHVRRYIDDARGILTRSDDGRLTVNEIQLFPRITLGNSYTQEKKMIAVRLVHEARYDCFILSTVNSRVEVSPLFIFDS